MYIHSVRDNILYILVDIICIYNHNVCVWLYMYIRLHSRSLCFLVKLMSFSARRIPESLPEFPGKIFATWDQVLKYLQCPYWFWEYTRLISMHTSNISLGRMNHKDFTQFASSIPQKLRLALLYGALDEVEWHAEAQYDCMELGSRRVCTIMPLFDGPLYM